MAKYITANEAAEILQLKPRTISQYAKIGRLPAYRLKGTGQYYFIEEEIKESMERATNGGQK